MVEEIPVGEIEMEQEAQPPTPPPEALPPTPEPPTPKRKPGRPRKAPQAPEPPQAPPPTPKPKARKPRPTPEAPEAPPPDRQEFNIGDMSSAYLVSELMNRRRERGREMKASLYRSFVM